MLHIASLSRVCVLCTMNVYVARERQSARLCVYVRTARRESVFGLSVAID